MLRWRFLRGVAVSSAALAVPFLPTCRGKARGAANAPPSNVRQFAAALIAPPQEQTPTSPSPVNPSAPTHKVKVWTNEELLATRTPADIYIFKKEEQAAALVVENFNEIASCFAFGRPEGNTEETQKGIDATMATIRDSEQAVVQAQRAVSTAPDNLKLRNQMELAQRTAELNHAREQLWKLQEHLQELEKPQVQMNAPSQPSAN
jgi:hypothetical protein